MDKWEQVKLSDLGEIVGGATPSTSREEYYNGDIPWLTPKDLAGYSGRYISRGVRNITKAGLESCSARMLPPNTVLFSSRAPIGYVAIAQNELCTNQGFKSVVPNKNVDPLFLYYLLKYNKDKIEAMGSGTTFKEVSGATMRNIEVVVPKDVNVQKRIAAILSSLDDKIELNNKINANLEQQAQALFKAWFVDFEPFGGKMPEDWSVSSLADIAHYLNGLAMQKYRPLGEDGSIPVLKIKELRQGHCDAASDRCSAKIPPEYIIRDGDVIFSWSGSLLVDFWCGGKCGLNQHLFKVTSSHYDTWFFYSWTKYYLARFIAIATDKATTMGHIRRDALEDTKVLIPSEWNYQMLGNILAPMYRKIVYNRIVNRKLACLRDILLQRLMSGEIDVSDESFPKL